MVLNHNCPLESMQGRADDGSQPRDSDLIDRPLASEATHVPGDSCVQPRLRSTSGKAKCFANCKALNRCEGLLL